MTPMSEVILRQKSQLKSPILLINPPQDQLISFLDLKMDIWTWNYADYQYFKANQLGEKVCFTIEFPFEKPYEQIIIFYPKVKQQLNYILHQIAVHCALNTSVLLVGEKKGGIEGGATLLKAYGKSHKIDNARHCQLWQLFLQKQEAPKPLTHWLKYYDVECKNQSLTICSLVGVFSQNQLDIGTAELLPFLSAIEGSKMADFGCGSGVIASYLALWNPHATIIAYDVDAFALESTRLTIEKNQLHHVQVQAAVGIEDIEHGFDAVVSNPPFHQGIKTHYDVSENLCHQIKNHLTSKGELYLVANRFLNYPILLKQHFNFVHILNDKNGFRVIKAT